MIQGREDVVREQEAMRPVVEALIRSGQPTQLLEMVGSSLRHVRVASTSDHIKQTAGEASVPDWFADFFVHPDGGYSLAFTGSDGRSVVLEPDDTDEIQEVWDSASGLVWMFLGAALLSNMAILAGVRTGLKPIQDVLAALDSVEQGRLDTRLGRYRLPEANQVAAHFNTMTQALELAENDNRQLTKTLINLQEKERAALSRDLHDDLGQQITGIRAQAWLIPLKADDKPGLEQISASILSGCEQVDTGFRQMISNLYPVLLEQLGLESALKELLVQAERKQGIECRMSCDIDLASWSLEQATQVYRFTQEAINNAVRHGRAKQVSVCFDHDDECIHVAVSDNGYGRLPVQPGFGIRSMSERAAILGGRFSMEEGEVAGLTVKMTIPVSGAEP